MKIQIKLNLFKKRLRHDSQYSDTINENSDTNCFSPYQCVITRKNTSKYPTRINSNKQSEK